MTGEMAGWQTRCGARHTGTEMETESWFSQHKCKGKRDLNEMPMEILGRLARREITEEEAWALTEKR